MLLEIQNSAENDKFDRLDGFLDKFKIPNNNRPVSVVPEQKSQNLIKEPKTAIDLWQNICSQKDPTPSHNTGDAIANITLRKEHRKDDKQTIVLTESGKDSTKLDELISSNKTKQPVRDQDYWQRRKINNKAANRSRAKKRKLIEEGQKSIQIYEEENPKLKLSLQNLKNELNELKMKLKTYQKSELST
jgi:hypothetical protein